MAASTPVKHVFWFDDHKTPNVADVLAKEAELTVHRLAFDAPEEQNWAVMTTCHAYCITSARDEVPDQFKGTAALIARCPELLVMSTSGAGYDPVDVAACTEAGILVVNQSGANAEAVAEHVIAMMLSLSKNIPQTDRSLRTGARRRPRGLQGPQRPGTHHRHHRLGRSWASGGAHLLARGLRCTCWPMIPTSKRLISGSVGQSRRDLDELLAQADYITIHCPYNAETKGLIGRRELGPDAAACLSHHHGTRRYRR